MYKKIILAFLVFGAFTLTNCKKSESDDEPVPNEIVAPEISLPSTLGSVDGILAAVITSTTSDLTSVKVGTAYSVFYKGKNTSMKSDAGTVKINFKTTSKSNDNVYFFSASAAEPKGLDYAATILWDVSGNTSTDVPVIYDSDGSGFPNAPATPKSLILLSSQDKTISWSTSGGADSVMFILTGPSAVFKRVFSNSVTSFNLPSAEIVKLGKGAASLAIINYTVQYKAYDGKNYAFLKENIGLCNSISIN